ncbi:MAG: serine hydrolase domain-containing protein [Casimicrobiaceae bacterium]
MGERRLPGSWNSLFALAAGAAMVALVASVAGCGDDSQPPEVEIGNVLLSQWQARYAGAPGGLTAIMITPTREYFASTVAGAQSTWHFRGASTTKTYTAASIMLLEQRGQLRIDDLITATIPGGGKPYVPATPGFAIPNKGQITIRQLLGHRAGVFDVGNDDIPKTVAAPYAGRRYVEWVQETQGDEHTFTVDELVGVVASNQLVTDVPGPFHYSNTGYSLLAKIVEEISGKTFAQFLHDEFTVPNGLADVSFPDSGSVQTMPVSFFEGTTKQGGKYYPTTNRNVSWGIGEGNTITTPANLSRWIRRLIKGDAGVNGAQVAKMITCTPTGESHVAYGLGIECAPPALGYGHNGAITGYLTVARHDPATDVTIVVMTTLFDADDFPGVGDWLYDTAAKVRKVAGY